MFSISTPIGKKVFKLIKVAGFIIIIFSSSLLLYLLSAFCLSRICVDQEVTNQKDVTIYILTNGVHTDLVLPTKNDQIDWSREVRFENTLQKDSIMPFIALGWGDKGFYLETPTWADLKFRTAFNAAFALSSSAIHATYYKRMTEGPDCVKIEISKEQYARLIAYIQKSFSKDENGHFQHIRTTANYGLNDSFYEANGSYSLFRTCNTWANNGLKSCGQKASLWTPFDTGIFHHYKNN
jgi:uncharacterized protein (TIGR02117 family)